MVRAGEKNKT